MLDMFYMWLVQNGIANLLSIPCLERDGFRVSYDTNTCWLVHCPDGMILKFKKDTGVCEGFPYIDLENLDDHIITDHRSASQVGSKKTLLGKIKALRDKPKEKAVAFV